MRALLQKQMKDTVYKLQQRVDGYSTEAQVYQEGSDRINIEIPGVSDANAILEELGKPGSLEFQLTDGSVVLDGSQVASAEAGVQPGQHEEQRICGTADSDRRGYQKLLLMPPVQMSENRSRSFMMEK